MKHKGLVFGVSFALAFLFFLLLWLISLWLPLPFWAVAAGGGLVLLAGLLLSGRAYWRSSRVLNQLLAQHQHEEILYADIASWMDGRHEHTGALLITGQRFVFDTPHDLRGRRWQFHFPLGAILMVRDLRGYFYLAAGGQERRFKVFRCGELVKTIRTAAGMGQPLRGASPPGEADAPPPATATLFAPAPEPFAPPEQPVPPQSPPAAEGGPFPPPP